MKMRMLLLNIYIAEKLSSWSLRLYFYYSNRINKHTLKRSSTGSKIYHNYYQLYTVLSPATIYSLATAQPGQQSADPIGKVSIKRVEEKKNGHNIAVSIGKAHIRVVAYTTVYNYS